MSQDSTSTGLSPSELRKELGKARRVGFGRPVSAFERRQKTAQKAAREGFGFSNSRPFSHYWIPEKCFVATVRSE
jgi:hypothetical protein